ncbi:RmlC-like cupin domain-containing protein [Talaromyces proteolyticus]|uniref:Cysteine dioxygenase n=1 Tax=Talaromyces proteolyticus TaxID=1131652 RepID=A0AAD4L3F5_9EURO|nr:RmlC-like cupin domain-containing protein [Talaromyces proteolyticus]KAH8705217.1 RmlC-like cupin domain-containing protein [Talaromyces proteolyticus]
MLSLVIPSTPLVDQDFSRLSPYSPRDHYSLHDLVKDIKAYLGSDSGINSSTIDEAYLQGLLRKYMSNPNDWFRYFYNDYSKNYTRNTIENINHKANILLLVWNPGKGSPIHDHANAHCIMKVLAGELTETVYHSPEESSGKEKPLVVKSETRHGINDVTYISDDIGLHRVHNPSTNQIAVSLHLYTPPNAADYGYHIFDANTGKASFVSQARSFLRCDEGKEK